MPKVPKNPRYTKTIRTCTNCGEHYPGYREDPMSLCYKQVCNTIPIITKTMTNKGVTTK